MAALALAAGCESATVGQPPAFSGVKQIPAQSFAKAWDEDLNLAPGVTITRLYLRDNLVFAYASDNQVFAIDRKAGTLAFLCGPIVPAGQVLRAPVVYPAFVAFPTSHTVETYSLKGKFLRSIDLGFSTTCDGAGMDNNLIIGSNEPGGRVAEIDMTMEYGYHKWSLDTGMILGTPISHEGACYIGSTDGNVYAINEDRAATWSLEDGVFKTYGPIIADMCVDNTGCFVAGTDGRLYCIDRSTGKLKWEYFAQANLTVGPASTPGSLYLPIPGTGLAAISKNEGDFIRKARWVDPNATELLAEDAKFAYVLNADGTLAALNRATGELKFQSGKPGFTAYAQNIKDGIIYAAGANGHVYSIKSVITSGSMGEIVQAKPTLETVQLACSR
jgi:outer membrane protein assembly factor BamB